MYLKEDEIITNAVSFNLIGTDRTSTVHRENQDCDYPVHGTGCDVTCLRKRLRFYSNLYLKELE